MSNINYGIGGNERPIATYEAIGEIPSNRTLMIEKLTDEDPVKPEIVEGLTSIDDIFNYFRPNKEIEFETEDGATNKEVLNFKNLGDFGVKGITAQSDYLKGLSIKKDQFDKIVKQLRVNKLLVNALQDPESKNHILNSLKALIRELEEA